ncbi:MAG: hypothetical protein H0V12_06915 [Chloroflexi bacterium]|nr:hypothetical protein [Chloroflexota bacterium]
MSARDVSVVLRLSTDKSAAGTAQGFVMSLRRVDSGTHYRARIQFRPDGAVQGNIYRTVGGAVTNLTGTSPIAGLDHAANRGFRVRFEAEGTSPTTLRLRVWADGTPEPTGWNQLASDSIGPQGSGAVGWRTEAGAATTNGPILFTIDDLEAQALGAAN